MRSQGSEIRFFKSTARLRSWERALGRARVLKTKISKPDSVRSPKTYFEQKRVIPSLEPQVESFGFTDSRTVLPPQITDAHRGSRTCTRMKSQKTKTNPQNKEKMNKKRPKARVDGQKKTQNACCNKVAFQQMFES